MTPTAECDSDNKKSAYEVEDETPQITRQILYKANPIIKYLHPNQLLGMIIWEVSGKYR